MKAVEGHFDPELSPLEERVKRLKNAMSSLISPAKMAKNALVDRQRAWMAEEKRKAEAEQRRRQEEIQRAQREKADRERREADAQAAEAKRQAVAEINREYARGAFGKRELAKRLKAAGAEEEAAKATAAAIAEETKNAPPPVVTVQPNIPKVAGIKNQTFYYAEVTSEDELIEAFGQVSRSAILKDCVSAPIHYDCRRLNCEIRARNQGRRKGDGATPWCPSVDKGVMTVLTILILRQWERQSGLVGLSWARPSKRSGSMSSVSANSGARGGLTGEEGSDEHADRKE